MFTVLLAEDDETLCGTLTKHLEAWGYRVVAVRDFSRVTQEFAAAAPHIVLLDILLPYYDGYHWCREIRKISDVPIVFLSSASDNMNLVMAIHMGGDDFVAKPFDASVLMAKMRAVLRRTYESSRRLAVIEHRGAVLNLNDFTLSYDGLFFLGVYLGALFLAATVLIMYYKQISEGFEDRKRFAIMQKVGLRYDEIKRCIASQILSVFFLPLLAAGVHVLFAFPMIGRLLGTMGFFRTDLFARATLACFGCFSLIYVAVYLLTASAYYKIVRENPMTPAL